MGEDKTSREKSGEEAKVSIKRGSGINEGEEDRVCQALEEWRSDRVAEENKSRGIRRGMNRNPPMQSLMVGPSGLGR